MHDMWAQYVSRILYASSPHVSRVGTSDDAIGLITSENFGPLEITYIDGNLPVIKAKLIAGERVVTTIDIR